MKKDTTPVLVGVGQLVQKDIEPTKAMEPLALMMKTAQLASEDADVGNALLKEVDYLGVTDVMSWRYPNLPRILAEKLEIYPKEEVMTYMGGNMSQWLVNHVARMIANEKIGVALLTGGECRYTVRHAMAAGIKLNWTTEGAGKAKRIGGRRRGISDHEIAYGLSSPTDTYALFENAWRAHRKLDFEGHRKKIGGLLSSLSAVAAQNPYAWIQKFFTPDEITRPAPDNRMISFPYTVRMCANWAVDKSSSVLMTSVSKARALGIPEDQWVYWLGGGEADEAPWFISERPNFYSCPSMGVAFDQALTEARMTVDQLDFFDLYSCFHIAVRLAYEELGIGEDDPRPLTVSGGLPYAGQSGNNCGMDSIVSMIERLRSEPGKRGLVTGNGWFLTKQSAAIYSTMPIDPSAKHKVPEDIPSRTHVEVVTGVIECPGVIETYTVGHSRDGEPERGLVIGRIGDGRRFIANTPQDRRLLEALMQEEHIGRSGRLTFHKGFHYFTPD